MQRMRYILNIDIYFDASIIYFEKFSKLSIEGGLLL